MNTTGAKNPRLPMPRRECPAATRPRRLPARPHDFLVLNPRPDFAFDRDGDGFEASGPERRREAPR